MDAHPSSRQFGLIELVVLCTAVAAAFAPLTMAGEGGLAARFAVFAALTIPPVALLVLAQRMHGARPVPLGAPATLTGRGVTRCT